MVGAAVAAAVRGGLGQVDGGAGVADPGQLKLGIPLLFNLAGGGVDCEGAPVRDKKGFFRNSFAGAIKKAEILNSHPLFSDMGFLS